MLDGLKEDLSGLIKKIEEAAANLQIMFGQKQGIEHAITKIEAAVPSVEADISKVEAVVDAVSAPAEGSVVDGSMS